MLLKTKGLSSEREMLVGSNGQFVDAAAPTLNSHLPPSRCFPLPSAQGV
jgi:hypothetical protein